MTKYIKKLYLVIIIWCIIPIYAMEYLFQNNNILIALAGIPLGIKIFSTIYNRRKTDAEFSNIVLKADRNKFSENYLTTIKKYLNREIDPNIKVGKDEKTILILAIKYERNNFLQYLLKNFDIDINASNCYGRTPLHYAIEYQSNPQEICKELLKLRADPNALSEYVIPPLHSAIMYRENKMIKLLAQYNANINDKEIFDNPLAFCLQYHPSIGTIKDLCNARASLHNIDNNNNSAFHLAVKRKKSKKYIQALIAFAHINPFDFYPIDEHKQQRKTVIETLLVLKKFYPEIDPHCQFTILSHIALLNKFTGFNKKFCKYLFNIDYKKPFIFHTNNQVQNIAKILQTPNKENKTALDLLNSSQDLEYKQKVISLIDENELQKHLEDFNIAVSSNNKLTLDNKNVIAKIFLL